MDPFKKSLGINFGPLFSVANGTEVPIAINSDVSSKSEKKNTTQLQSSTTLEPPQPSTILWIPVEKPTGIGEIMGYYVIDWVWYEGGGYWVPVLGNPVRGFGGGGGTSSGGYSPGNNPSGRGVSSGGSSGGSAGRPNRKTSDEDQGGSPMGVKSTVRRNPNQPQQRSGIAFYLRAERPFNRPIEYFESELDPKEKYSTLLELGKQFGWTLEKILEARKKKPIWWHCDKNLQPDQSFCCPEHVQQVINDFYQSLFDDPQVQRNPKFLQCLSENWPKLHVSCLPDWLYEENLQTQDNENYPNRNDRALAKNILNLPVDSIVTWNLKSDGNSVAEINPKYKHQIINQLLARCTQLYKKSAKLDYRAQVAELVMGTTPSHSESMKLLVDSMMKRRWMKELNRYWDPCKDRVHDSFYTWDPQTGTVWINDENGKRIEPPIISNDPAWKWPC